MDASLIAALVRQTVLGPDEHPDAPHAAGLGTIRLRPHQIEAVARLHRAISVHGGALLADDPGMGKTFVALAVARAYRAPLVIAPAAVREAWRQSAVQAGLPIRFVSCERLSRTPFDGARPGVVVIDEAQHAGSAGTARRRHIERICAGRPVLLLSATPVRNRLEELRDLLALFRGREAPVDETLLAECIVRRTGDPTLVPRVVAGSILPIPRTVALDRAIRDLPPAAPLHGGSAASTLLAISLLRCRASSIAALTTALLRRLQRGAALDAALAQGEWPSARELRQWIAGDDAIQLQLLLTPPRDDTAPWRETLRTHSDAVRALLLRAQRSERADTAARVEQLRSVLAAHPDRPVIAFAQHAATVRALFRALRHEPGVALLTASGARSASGVRSRRELISSLEPGHAEPPAHDRVRLLLATDLLSEGVNLQRAGVVVHLDLPWTPARLRQRIGRVARMGSERTAVHEYHLAPAHDVERILAMARRHRIKARSAEAATAASASMERLRVAVREWTAGPADDTTDTTQAFPLPFEGRILGTRTGLLAVIESPEGRSLLGAASVRAPIAITAAPEPLACLVECVVLPLTALAVQDAHTLRRCRRALERFLQRRMATDALGRSGERLGVRRRLLLRAAAALRDAPAASRGAIAVDVERLRRSLRNAPAAGVDPIVARLLSSPRDDEPQWLRTTTRELDLYAAPAATTGTESALGGAARAAAPRLVALLVITPGEGAPATPPPIPAPRDAPRAVSS